MPNVVTPFTRKKKHDRVDPAQARHRRDGFFDEHDNWHDVESTSAVTADGTPLR